jgi:hypothetical protein
VQQIVGVGPEEEVKELEDPVKGQKRDRVQVGWQGFLGTKTDRQDAEKREVKNTDEDPPVTYRGQGKLAQSALVHEDVIEIIRPLGPFARPVEDIPI